MLPEKSGQSANGQWRKQEYILETESNFPKKICFMAWGDKIDQFNIRQGDNVEVAIDLESREYNGRWYTDVKAWKVSKGDTSTENAQSYGIQDQYEPSNPNDSNLSDDTIPF
ncbi:DUF3127 domain-containing protein [Pseudopelagicola sp. nBUS_20]|uniref:DUF3127 domain-containing protein n=1 Tax=Pseudopelagicola sp. nBUS_20 TaxID=3395317 RepID=UPI003EC0FA33